MQGEKVSNTSNTFRAAIRRWTYHSPGVTRKVTVSPEVVTFRVFREGVIRYERGKVATVTRSRPFGSSSIFTFYDTSGRRLKYLLAPWRPGRAQQVLIDNGWAVMRE
jgi:hypothetical protein